VMRKLFIVMVVLALAAAFFLVGCGSAGKIAQSAGSGVVAGLSDAPVPLPPIPSHADPIGSEGGSGSGGLGEWLLNFLAVLAGYTVGSLGKGTVRKYLPDNG